MQDIEMVKCEYCSKMLTNKPRSIGSHIGFWHKDKAQEIFHKETEFSIKCLECDKPVANSNNVLGRHLRKVHSLEFPDYLVKHEHEGKWPICSCGCGQKLRWKKGGFQSFYSIACSSKGENNGMFGLIGEESPNFGKIRTVEHKKRYSKAAQKRWDEDYEERCRIFQTVEYKAKMQKIGTEISERPEVKEKKSVWSLRWWQRNPQMREVFSKRAFKLLEEKKIGPQAPFKTEDKFNPFTKQFEYMHSSWESLFLDVQIANDNPVTKKHDIRIDYLGPDNINHKYQPDFISLNDKTIYELKGNSNEFDEIKREVAKKWCEENGYAFLWITDVDFIKEMVPL